MAIVLEFSEAQSKQNIYLKLFEQMQSDFISSCILVLNPDGTYRMCTDYRSIVNSTTQTRFPFQEQMTAFMTSDMQNSSIC